MPHSPKGFSLIESAIVLGVVGLVIGGIWVAASAVNSNLRMSNTVVAILQMVQGGQKLFPLQSYPTAVGYTFSMNTMQAAGVLPGDFTLFNSNLNAKSPAGAVFYGALQCHATYPCPSFTIGMMSQSFPDVTRRGSISYGECTQIVRRIGAVTSGSNQLLRLTIFDSSNGMLVDLSNQGGPINTSNIACPTNTSYVQFFFPPVP